MTFIAFCHQDGVLCAQSMCLSSMEYLVNFWSRLTSACLSQDCQLFLQTYVIDSRGMDKGTLHSEGFKHCFFFFYHCTVHFDNVKIYIKMSYIRSYMFWSILRELTLCLAKVTLFLELISKNTSL